MEPNKTSPRINVVIYAKDQDSASELAKQIVPNPTPVANVYSETIEGVEVVGYLRWPECVPNASPLGVTDILLAQVENADSDNWENTRKYIDIRKGIPFKFIVSNEHLSDKAKELSSEFIKQDDLSKSIQKIVKSALDLEETLRKVFNKIDEDKNGYINDEEIIKAAKELDHTISESDAFEITRSLSKEGKVSYPKFKQWWIMGRTDFSAFRKLVKVELIMNDFIKQSSQTFNSYLEKLKKEGETQTSESDLSSKFFLGTSDKWEPGLAFNIHTNVGRNFDNISSELPSYIKESPITFGLEFKTNDENAAKESIPVLEGIQEMIIGMVPEVKEFIDNGVTINYRVVGSSVFIDVTYGGMLGDTINGLLQVFNLSSINFAGTSDLRISTKVSPVDIVKENVEKLIEMATHLNIEGSGEFAHLKTFTEFISEMVKIQFGDAIPKKMLPIIYALRLPSVVKKINFEFKYDPSVILDYIIEASNSKTFEPIQGGPQTAWEEKTQAWNEEKDEQVGQGVEQGTAMAGMVLEPYKDTLLKVNLENISVYVCSPILKGHIKLSLFIRGINEFVKETLA